MLLGSGVNLTATLRILVDIMAVTGSVATWTAAADRVRHGGKLSDALLASSNMPPMAIRMLRLGEETGQLPVLAGRVAEFYEAKLQRSLDRIVGIIGPLAIITISTVVGGIDRIGHDRASVGHATGRIEQGLVHDEVGKTRWQVFRQVREAR